MRTANAALPPNKNARVFIRLGCASKFPHLRDLFRPDARNFPRHHEVGFGDVRRIFAFFIAQICAVQISGVIIEKSRRSCCFPRSPRLVTSDKLEEFHEAKCVFVNYIVLSLFIAPPARTAQSGTVRGNSRATCTKTYTSESVAAHGAAMRRPHLVWDGAPRVRKQPHRPLCAVPNIM